MYNPNSRFFPLAPAHALPPLAARYSYELAEELRVDTNIIACAMLSTAMVASLGGIECIVSSDFKVPSVLWILVGAPSGAGKTPVFQRVQGVLEQLIASKVCLTPERRMDVESRMEVLEQRLKVLKRQAARIPPDSYEMHVAKLVAAKQEMDSLKVPISPIVDRMSLYAFTQEMSKRNGVMAAFGAEGSLLAGLSMVSTELLQPLLKSWSNEEIAESSKKRGEVRVPFPRLNIGVGWQTHEARRLLCNEKYIGIGLTARFLYCEAYSRSHGGGCGVGLSDDSKLWWTGVLENLLDAYLTLSDRDSINLVLSCDAKLLLDSFERDFLFPIDSVAGVSEFLRKRGSHAVRIAIALHCLEFDTLKTVTISFDTMQKACNLTFYFANQLYNVQIREREAKVRSLAFKLCQVYSKNQVGQFYPGITYTTHQLGNCVGKTHKLVSHAMYWLAEKKLVCSVAVPLNNGKTVDGWQALQFLNQFLHEDMLP